MNTYTNLLNTLADICSAYRGHLSLRRDLTDGCWVLRACLPDGMYWTCCGDSKLQVRFHPNKGTSFRRKAMETLLECVGHGVADVAGQGVLPASFPE